MVQVWAIIAAAVDMFCYYCSFCDKEIWKNRYFVRGECVILKPDTRVLKGDEVLWKFGPQETLIAEIREGAREIFEFADGNLKDRLELSQNGSLTIKNSRPSDSGRYKLQVNSRYGVSHETFSLNVSGCGADAVHEQTEFAMEGMPITLWGFPDIQKDELILWLFGDQETLIAQMTRGSRKTFDGPDGIFRGRLKLEKRTGSLTIRRMKFEHSGNYKVQVSCCSRGTYYKMFKVITNGMFGPKTLSVKEGAYFGLDTDTLIRKGEQVQWRFEGTILATGMNGDLKKTSYCDDERFRDRLELDHQRGDLLFTKAKTSDTGVYHLEINSSKRTTIHREYTLTVLENTGKESETAEIPLLSQEDVGGVEQEILQFEEIRPA